jgi:hypothetical protein
MVWSCSRCGHRFLTFAKHAVVTCALCLMQLTASELPLPTVYVQPPVITSPGSSAVRVNVADRVAVSDAVTIKFTNATTGQVVGFHATDQSSGS